MKMALALLLVIGLAAGGAAYYTTHMAADPATNFRTVAIKRGDLLSTITATGTVEPEEVVDVGAQIVGRIKSLGVEPAELKGRNESDIDPKERAKMKHVDYGSIVHEGTVLARIDPAVYRAQVDQAAASLARAKADLLQLQARFLQAEQEWKRAQSLLPAKAIADTDYDLAVANYTSAKANIGVGDAVIKQCESSLELAKTNYEYTVIQSPVEGVIIARRVNIGQTVVASLNAPSLFLIGKDLRRIEVWASVNEADIGRIHAGMPVRFSVDAFPGETFRGKVDQIRLNATMTQNVVTYTVVVATDNSDGRLLPYLTANVQFEIEQRTNVMLVPNAALRWKPKPQQIDPEMREALAASSDKDDSPVPPSGKTSGEAKSGKAAKDRDDPPRLWTEVDGFVRPLTVTVGPTDGVMTEISGDGLKEGMEIVVGQQRKEDAEQTTNPFMPQLFRGKRPQKQQ
jgi:HlyD family secretion protein